MLVSLLIISIPAPPIGYSSSLTMEGGQEKYEPLPRWGHVSVAIGDKMYLWGGRIENFSEDSQKKVSES